MREPPGRGPSIDAERGDAVERIAPRAAVSPGSRPHVSRRVASLVTAFALALVVAALVLLTREPPAHSHPGEIGPAVPVVRERVGDRAETPSSASSNARIPVRILCGLTRAPIAGASVAVLAEGGSVHERRLTTDATGLVVLTTGIGKKLKMRVSVSGYHDLVEELERVPGEDVYELVMRGAGTIVGSVYDASGAPIPGARVTARVDDRLAAATAAPDGRFEIVGTPVGRRIDVTVGGGRWKPSTVEVVPDPVARADFRLESQLLATAVVSLPGLKGTEFRGEGDLRITTGARLLASGRVLIAGDTGARTFPCDGEGEIAITLSIGDVSYRRVVPIVRGDDSGQDTYLARAEFPEFGVTTFAFRAEGKPLARTEIIAMRGVAVHASVHTDSAGHAAMLSTASTAGSGSSSLFFLAAEGASSAFEMSTEYSARRDVDLGWNCSRIVVRGATAESCEIQARADPSLQLLSRTTESEIEFSVTPGFYRLARFGVGAGPFDIVITGADQRVEIDVAESGGDIHGQAESDAKVRVYAVRNRRKTLLSSPHCDADGYFAARSVPGGDALVTVVFANGATWSKAVEVRDRSVVDLGLIDWNHLERRDVTILAADGTRLAADQVRLHGYPRYLHERPVRGDGADAQIWLDSQTQSYMVGAPGAFGLARRSTRSLIRLPSRSGALVAFPTAEGVVTQALWMQRVDDVDWFISLRPVGDNAFEIPKSDSDQHFVVSRGSRMDFYTLSGSSREEPPLAHAAPRRTLDASLVPPGARVFDLVVRELFGTDLVDMEFKSGQSEVGESVTVPVPRRSKLTLRFFDERGQVLARVPVERGDR